MAMSELKTRGFELRRGTIATRQSKKRLPVEVQTREVLKMAQSKTEQLLSWLQSEADKALTQNDSEAHEYWARKFHAVSAGAPALFGGR